MPDSRKAPALTQEALVPEQHGPSLWLVSAVVILAAAALLFPFYS